MDIDTSEDKKGNICIKTEETEIKEEMIEHYEKSFCEEHLFERRSFSQEYQKEPKEEVIVMEFDPLGFTECDETTDREEMEKIQHPLCYQENSVITGGHTEVIQNLSQPETKMFKCSYCSYRSKRKDDLKKHIFNHSEIKKYKCSRCSYETNWRGNLKNHLLTHSKTKLFKCSECSYETNRNDSLKLHVRTHSGTKLFKCSECDYEANQKYHLKVHLLNHSKTKLFKCTKCNYETNNNHHLKIHSLNHSETKLFKCSDCSYETNRKDRLKIHLQRNKCEASPLFAKSKSSTKKGAETECQDELS